MCTSNADGAGWDPQFENHCPISMNCLSGGSSESLAALKNCILGQPLENLRSVGLERHSGLVHFHSPLDNSNNHLSVRIPLSCGSFIKTILWHWGLIALWFFICKITFLGNGLLPVGDAIL